MATINQIKRQRRTGFQLAKRVLRELDTRIEMMQRLVQRILDRTEKVPEVSDLQRFSDMMQQLIRAANEGRTYLAKNMIGWY